MLLTADRFARKQRCDEVVISLPASETEWNALNDDGHTVLRTAAMCCRAVAVEMLLHRDGCRLIWREAPA